MKLLFLRVALVQRSGRGIRLLQEEPQHLAAGVRPARVGIGPGRAATRPGVAGSVKHPLLEDGTPALVSLDGASVGGPALSLPTAHRRAEICPCLGLGNDLIAVDRAHGGVAITVKHDGRHRTPRPVARRASRAALPHGGERGGKVLGHALDWKSRSRSAGTRTTPQASPECTPIAAYRSG